MTADASPPMPTSTVVFAGHARLPQGSGERLASAVVTVEAEVDTATGEIVDATCYPASRLAERLVRSILRGRNLQDGLDASAEELLRRYISPSQRALATAVANVYETYVRWKTATHGPASSDPRATRPPGRA